jgi:hypothetical protein
MPAATAATISIPAATATAAQSSTATAAAAHRVSATAATAAPSPAAAAAANERYHTGVTFQDRNRSCLCRPRYKTCGEAECLQGQPPRSAWSSWETPRVSFVEKRVRDGLGCDDRGARALDALAFRWSLTTPQPRLYELNQRNRWKGDEHCPGNRLGSLMLLARRK